ncbi:MAG: carbohydrate ABC transporter permease [Clostridia bacterium]|nr:carbohydrate ABC transporter permease [Clostridia bacterium]
MNNNNTAPRVKRETKNKIKVDFDRTPLKDRLKAKYLNAYFYKKVLIAFFRFVLLLGLSYIILFPFFSKVASSFMSPRDFLQTDVKYIPKFPTINQYKYLITENGYFKAFLNTFLLSGACALLQTFVCAFIGYGFAKFKFKGNGAMFIVVLVTMLLPHQFMQSSMYLKFRYFVLDSTGIYSALGLSKGLIDTVIPLIILSMTGLAFKNGLFIFIMRQFYRGVPDELEESSYVDGYGVFKTFFYIILPLSVPMLVTVFILAFSWQWTDTFYTNLFLPTTDSALLTSISFWQKMPETLSAISVAQLTGTTGASELYSVAVKNTAGFLVIIPLIIMYLFCQRRLIQGIEHSGFGGM